MPLPSHIDGRLRSPPLALRVPEGASATQVAEAVVELWREIDQALHPIIGHRGVAALYLRSLRLTAPAYPWLALDPAGMPAAIDCSALEAALVQQSPAQAFAGGSALIDSFRVLLASLVGAPLAERLLDSVWAPPSGAPPAQDTSS